MILGIKMTPTLVEKVIKNMIDFWIAPGRALDGVWVGPGGIDKLATVARLEDLHALGQRPRRILVLACWFAGILVLQRSGFRASVS